MFCKYCGEPLEGTKCPACGRETILSACSVGLNRLAAEKPEEAAETEPFPMPEDADSGEFDETEEDAPVRRMSGGESRTGNEKKRQLICCLLAFLLGALLSGIISGLICYHAGFSRGQKNGGAVTVETVVEAGELTMNTPAIETAEIEVT